MYKRRRKVILCIIAILLCASQTYAQRMQRNQLEIGLQGGMMYYVGDANAKMFQHIREAYGAEFSYLFNQRWSLMLQGTAGRIAGRTATEQGLPDPQGELWTNYLVNIDVAARFNFLPYGMADKFDKRIKQYTPYIYAGIGVTMYDKFGKAAAYIPVGVGFKWMCSEHVQMYLAWQHDICFTDNMEPVPYYNNIHGLNGSNILNCDLMSTLQFGIVFEFAKQKKICKFCGERE